MSLHIQVTPLRIVHWDYKQFEVTAPAESNIQMLSGLLRDADTNEKTGFYIRWALRVFIDTELTLSSIGESDFRVNVEELNKDIFIKAAELSLQEFKREMGIRIKQTNLTIYFDVQVTQDEASEILRELCEQ